ncbi:FG-GAP-like repeat-containing protein [Desulfuromonas versatilis]|nr:FG-GAP-like repeat-containing protein [Desulfuromonas versatilis]
MASVIWPNPAISATAPVIQSLGQMRYGQGVPTRIALDDLGNLYLADTRQSKVVKFDIYGKQAASLPVPQLSGAIAVSPDGSKIYAASNRTAVVVLDGATGSVLGHLGGGQNEFGYAYDLDLDKDGYIFVADSQKLSIRSYNPSGALQLQFGSQGSGNGQFNSIASLEVNRATGEIFVSDTYLTNTIIPRIQVFASNGTFLRSMNSTAGFAGTATQYSFAGMAFDNAGRGYFLNDGQSTLIAVGLPSSHLLTYSQKGVAAGQLMTPWDVAYDPSTKRLFVLCADNRVEILGIDGGQNPVYVNNKPSVPAPVSPMAGGEVATVTPALAFRGASDADGDPLSYDIEVVRNGQTAQTLTGVAAAQDPASVKVSSPLEENAAYSWRVRAFDGIDYSDWSGLQSFVVNAQQEAPTAPELVAPLGGETRSGAESLNWQASSDPDPSDRVSYKLEISPSADFALNDAEELLDATSIQLSDLTAYPALNEGQSYFWRVIALDNHGEASLPSSAGQFVYDTTLLKVSANMPGARVYLGGNYAYAGRFVGEAPLELRDIPAGPCSVVVERSGFETFIAQINPLEGENAEVYAELVPVLVPAGPKSHSLTAGDQKLALPADATPFAVDFDNDGTTDLLVGDATGAVTLYRGLAGDTPRFAAGVPVSLPLIPGASPFVADWDNDGRKDLLLGGADGSVTLFLNTGSEAAPAFGAGQPLPAAAVSGGAIPAVIDLDDDGAKDLVVGDDAGKLFLFRNVGSDQAPALLAAGQVDSAGAMAGPCFVDWDGDGNRDLLLAAGDDLLFCTRQADGSYAGAKAAFAEEQAPGKRARKALGSLNLGSRTRLFALDVDRLKGKDLLAGNAAGELIWVRSNGRNADPSFLAALKDKVAQVNLLLQTSPGELGALGSSIDSHLASGQYKAATRAAANLLANAPAGTELATAAGELEKLLQFAN